jgi:hypothetical protein
MGCLRVTIVAARNLIPMDKGDTSDPFVTLKVQDKTRLYRSSVVKKSLDPTWNETFDFRHLRPQVRHAALLRLRLRQVQHQRLSRRVLAALHRRHQSRRRRRVRRLAAAARQVADDAQAARQGARRPAHQGALVRPRSLHRLQAQSCSTRRAASAKSTPSSSSVAAAGAAPTTRTTTSASLPPPPAPVILNERPPPIRSRWEIDPVELQLGAELGRGAFGVVFRARWRQQDVAVKQVAYAESHAATSSRRSRARRS